MFLIADFTVVNFSTTWALTTWTTDAADMNPQECTIIIEHGSEKYPSQSCINDYPPKKDFEFSSIFTESLVIFHNITDLKICNEYIFRLRANPPNSDHQYIGTITGFETALDSKSSLGSYEQVVHVNFSNFIASLINIATRCFHILYLSQHHMYY